MKSETQKVEVKNVCWGRCIWWCCMRCYCLPSRHGWVMLELCFLVLCDTMITSHQCQLCCWFCLDFGLMSMVNWWRRYLAMGGAERIWWSSAWTGICCWCFGWQWPDCDVRFLSFRPDAILISEDNVQGLAHPYLSRLGYLKCECVSCPMKDFTSASSVFVRCDLSSWPERDSILLTERGHKVWRLIRTNCMQIRRMGWGQVAVRRLHSGYKYTLARPLQELSLTAFPYSWSPDNNLWRDVSALRFFSVDWGSYLVECGSIAGMETTADPGACASSSLWPHRHHGWEAYADFWRPRWA